MMDPQTKEFTPVSPEVAERLEAGLPDRRFKDGVLFKVGQVFTLNGVEMSIRKITKKDVVLRPVK